MKNGVKTDSSQFVYCLRVLQLKRETYFNVRRDNQINMILFSTFIFEWGLKVNWITWLRRDKKNLQMYYNAPSCAPCSMILFTLLSFIHCTSCRVSGEKTTISVGRVWLLPCPQLYSRSVYFRTANMPLEAKSWRATLMESRFLTLGNSKNVFNCQVFFFAYLCLSQMLCQIFED